MKKLYLITIALLSINLYTQADDNDYIYNQKFQNNTGYTIKITYNACRNLKSNYGYSNKQCNPITVEPITIAHNDSSFLQILRTNIGNKIGPNNYWTAEGIGINDIKIQFVNKKIDVSIKNLNNNQNNWEDVLLSDPIELAKHTINIDYNEKSRIVTAWVHPIK